MAHPLPDLSGLPLQLHETVDVGQDLRNAGIRKARQRKPRLPDLARLVIDDADPYAGWTEEEDDEDWAVPEELQDLERVDAARTRIVPHRRSPAVAEEVRTNRGESGKLFYAIRNQVLGVWRDMAEWYWCENWATGRTLTPEQKAYVQKIMLNHDEVAQGILRKYVLKPSSWMRTAYYSVRGMIHDTVVPEASFRQFFEDYVRLRGGMDFLSDFSKTPKGRYTQVEWEDSNQLLVAQMLAVHAHLLAPLVDAIREFGFVPEGHTDLQVLWRFHPVRHNNASNWHMDENRFNLYGDESMRRADAWTSPGTLGRDVVVPEHRPAPAGGQLRHAHSERPACAHGAGGQRHLGRHVGGQGHAAELQVPTCQGGVLWRQAEPRDQERHGARHCAVHRLPRHARLHAHGAGPDGAPGARREAACLRGR